MGRVCHILKPNTEPFSPRHFIFFDTETLPKKVSKNEMEQVFRLGVACYWRIGKEGRPETIKWLNFKDLNTFWDFVEKHSYQETPLYVLAHNIDFDMKVAKGFNQMRARGYKLVLFINNNLAKIWRYNKDKKRIVFLDNLNYFVSKLEQLGKDVGVEKMEMPKFWASNKKWFIYCKRDVEVLLALWKKYLGYVRENNLGNFAPTIASQSFNAFRHRFMNTKIYIHNSEKVTKLERESYHGARTECFYIGRLTKEPFYLLDVNSMYPYLMMKEKYPTKLISFNDRVSFFALKRWLEKFSVIAKVELETKEPIFPIKIESRLCFPTGNFQSVLTTNEIKFALEKNYIKRILEVAVYQKENLFKEYVNYFYGQKLRFQNEGNKTFTLISKIFLNSLYGKFGQKNDVWEEKGFNKEKENGYFEEWDVKDQKLYKYRVIEGKIEESKGTVEAYNSFPAISSEVCANGRLLLWSFINQAGRENVFYCDTDSLIVNREGLVKLSDFISPERIGYLKVVKETNDLTIFAPKYYKFGDDLKIKGVKKDAQRIGDHKFIEWHFQSIKGALRKGNLNKQMMYKITKTLKRDYKKGRVLKNGKVIPFKLNKAEDNFSLTKADKSLS